MRSSFWHVGVNKSLEERYLKEGWRAPRILPDWSIEWKPLPDHNDPDFKRLTYGEPWGRIKSLQPGDVAFFIESATGNEWESWAYYVVAAFITENVYSVFDRAIEAPRPKRETARMEQAARVQHNAHWLRGDRSFAVLLGDIEKSKLLFRTPLVISKRQDPLPNVKTALGLEPARRYTGYWWKQWFGDSETKAMMGLIESHQRIFSEALGIIP